MGDCCGSERYGEVFGDSFARRVARRYGRRGLDRTRTRLIDFLLARGVGGATVLEIGGGIGELHLELLRRGARSATNLELSHGYEQEAARLLGESGLGDRVTRRSIDIATSPDDVAPADLVVLHRVVCCYPDYERLLTAAAGHADRLLVFSHPSRTLLSRTMMGVDNAVRRMRRDDFRAFVHPPAEMDRVVTAQGMVRRYRHRGPVWTVVGYERSTAA